MGFSMRDSFKLDQEIDLIVHPVIRDWVKWNLSQMDERWWTRPASARYHPGFARGHAGLVNHIRAAVLCGVELANAFDLSEIERDIILAALLTHHCVDDLTQEGVELLFQEGPTLSQPAKESIVDVLENIKGRWSSEPRNDWYNDRLILAAHLADFMSSRPWLSISQL